jgi:cyclic pyranopterin phosphate synthase
MTTQDPNPLTHLTEDGAVHMVDVGGKEITARQATAEALVTMSRSLADRLFSGDLPKGDALATVRLAGIMAAKRTADVIPLAHPIALTAVTVEVERHPDGVRIETDCRVRERTGVEMEALTAAAVAALTLYDMVKAIERGVVIGPIRLLSKSGGRSGAWEAESESLSGE